MRGLFPLFCFFAGALLPLRAQLTLTPTIEKTMPSGHSFALDVRNYGNDVVLFTTDEVWTLATSTATWAKIGSMRAVGMRPLPDSAVAVRPGEPGYWYVPTYDEDDLLSFYRVRGAPPGQTRVPLAFGDLPRQVKVAADGTTYLLDQAGQVWRADNTSLANFTRLTDAVAGSRDLSLGSDGSVYVLDDARGVFRFSSSGSLLGQFTLAQNSSGANTPVFDISSSGYLFAMDLGSSTSSIYNAVTGAYVGGFAFNSADVNDPTSVGGNASLHSWTNTLTGEELLVAMTGSGSSVSVYNITAIPEPATWTLLAGAGALGLALMRRRKAAARG